MKELDLLRQIAAPMLTPAGAQAIEAARWALHGIPRNHEQATWKIDAPVSTKFSAGQYLQDGAGTHTIRANLTTVWDVIRHDQSTLEVRDNVSTVVEFESGRSRVASFRMDIAAVRNAPGCGLHTQIHNHREWFPTDLDVPRFPTFIPTFGAVMEFVLSELFQQGWSEHLSGHRLASSWRELQEELWRNYLEWQLEVTRHSVISPWVDLKETLCSGLAPQK